MPIQFRRIDADGQGLFGNIATEVFDEPILPENLVAYLADPGHLMILAIEDGLVVAMVMAVIHRHPDKPDELYIDEIGVSPAHRESGIARQLMTEMIEWGIERGCEEAWVGTEPENVAANATYTRYAKAEPSLIYMWDIGNAAT